ncbi:tocopherol cyclase family protein, partial [Rhodococcus sp. 7Tela_A2]
TLPWPRRRFGGSSVFQTVPALNQYWHPWLLGARAEGYAVLGDEKWDLDGAQVYGEKNWGKGGFPESWWWGQAQGFADPEACVAFAGGQVHSGPLRTEVTAVVVALPGGPVVRLGNPVTSPVRATVTDETWSLQGRNRRWSIEIEAASPIGSAHVLPVPLPAERRNVPGAIEHLAGSMSVTVRERGKTVWSGESRLAALEHGGLDRARAELDRRGADSAATDGPPLL